MIKRILIIEDDTDFAEACINFLEAADYEVKWENNEYRALETIREFRPGVILLDVVMNKENSGFEIADKISQDKELKTIPIVFLTGYFHKTGMIAKEEDFLDKWDNVKYVLDKPVKPSLLLKILKKIE